jgi:HEPN domain-containing protein
MILVADLKTIAKARVRDAEVLRDSTRYDGAVYLCGYAVEIVLKSRICRTLKWLGYPANSKEFDGYSSFRTHDLDVLLHLSGRETTIKAKHFAEWSVVATWDPNTRYRAIGIATKQDATDMVKATKVLVAVL